MCRLLLSICLMLSINGYSQKIRFTNINNKWNIRYINPDGTTILYSAYYGTDTVIGATNYHTLIDGLDPAYVREDTIANRVFVYNIFDSTEHILYDYNLQSGDTITEFRSLTAIRDSVINLDSTIINGVYHKVFTLQSPIPRIYTIVEGIGCMATPIFPVREVCFEGEKHLLCFSDNTGYPAAVFTATTCWKPHYTFTNSAYCTDYIFPLSQDEIVISPNPATDYLHLSGLAGHSKVYVYDLVGRCVLDTTTDQQELNIITAEWPRGPYYLIIGNNPKSGKLFNLE